MSKGSKGKLGGRNSNNGGNASSQRVVANDGQFVKSSSIIVMNTRTLKIGKNVYKSKHTIHAKVNGRVRIKDKYVSIEETMGHITILNKSKEYEVVEK